MNNKKIQYLKLSDRTASRSKDLSTKVGAVIVDGNEISPISVGYNGMPRGVNEDNKERNQRPEKYLWYEHAERNAIYNLARNVLQDKVMYSNSFPNMESARAIVSTGIQQVILEENLVKNEESNKVIELFKESKVDLIEVNRGAFDFDFDVYAIKNKLTMSDIEQYKKEKKRHSTLKKQIENLDFINEYGQDFAVTKNKSACVIMDNKNDIPISYGVFGPPPNMNIENYSENLDEISQEAEKNAIFYAVLPQLKDSNIYVSWCPCITCSLAIASVGIKKIVTRAPDFTQEADLRWKDSFEKSQIFLDKLGITIELLELENPNINNAKIIKESSIYVLAKSDLVSYSNTSKTIPIIKYFKQAFEDSYISEVQYNDIIEKYNNINYLHSNSVELYENYTKMFTVDGEQQSINRLMGSEFSGIDFAGVKLFVEHVEFGTSIIIDKEDDTTNVKKYLDLFNLLYEGLSNNSKYESLKSYMDLQNKIELKTNKSNKNKI